MRTFVFRGSVSPVLARKDPRGNCLNFLGSSIELFLCLLCVFINFYHPLFRSASRDESHNIVAICNETNKDRGKTSQSSCSDSHHVSASNLQRELRGDRQTLLKQARMTLDASSHFLGPCRHPIQTAFIYSIIHTKYIFNRWSCRHRFEQCGFGEKTCRVEGWEWSIVRSNDEWDLGAAEYCCVAAALLH